MLSGNRPALKYALTEVMLNGASGQSDRPRIGVRLHAEATGNGLQGLQIEVRGQRQRFHARSRAKGRDAVLHHTHCRVGLGLTVARKIVEIHGGRLEIVPPKSGQAGIVRISLRPDATCAAGLSATHAMKSRRR